MRLLLPLLALPFLAAPALAQGNCSDGTTGVIVSLEVIAVEADTVTVCLGLEGDPTETIRSVGFAYFYSGSRTNEHDPETIPPRSPYDHPPYVTGLVRCLETPYCDNFFWVGLYSLTGPYLHFSAEPVRFFCPRMVLTGPPDLLAVDIREVQAEQGDGTPASVCPPEDQGGFGVVVAAEPATPEAASTLHAPRPNPTRGPTLLSYEVEAPGHARLTVHDALGREVARPVDGPVGAGAHEIPFDPGALPDGVYLIRLEAANIMAVQLLTLVR
ncbi:MAG: hypothetical protein R3181_04740 [Rubricoccaceae bacterium]|nr:hypothetical protein [Rubricoccaceae bacterium]